MRQTQSQTLKKYLAFEYLTLRCTAGLLPPRRGAEFPFITTE
jgi:hypothetical protein